MGKILHSLKTFVILNIITQKRSQTADRVYRRMQETAQNLHRNFSVKIWEMQMLKISQQKNLQIYIFESVIEISTRS